MEQQQPGGYAKEELQSPANTLGYTDRFEEEGDLTSREGRTEREARDKKIDSLQAPSTIKQIDLVNSMNRMMVLGGQPALGPGDETSPSQMSEQDKIKLKKMLSQSAVWSCPTSSPGRGRPRLSNIGIAFAPDQRRSEALLATSGNDEIELVKEQVAAAAVEKPFAAYALNQALESSPFNETIRSIHEKVELALANNEGKRQNTRLAGPGHARVDLRSIKEAEKITAGFLSNIESFVSVQDDQERAPDALPTSAMNLPGFVSSPRQDLQPPYSKESGFTQPPNNSSILFGLEGGIDSQQGRPRGLELKPDAFALLNLKSRLNSNNIEDVRNELAPMFGQRGGTFTVKKIKPGEKKPFNPHCSGFVTKQSTNLKGDLSGRFYQSHKHDSRQDDSGGTGDYLNMTLDKGVVPHRAPGEAAHFGSQTDRSAQAIEDLRYNAQAPLNNDPDTSSREQEIAEYALIKPPIIKPALARRIESVADKAINKSPFEIKVYRAADTKQSKDMHVDGESSFTNYNGMVLATSQMLEEPIQPVQTHPIVNKKPSISIQVEENEQTKKIRDTIDKQYKRQFAYKNRIQGRLGYPKARLARVGLSINQLPMASGELSLQQSNSNVNNLKFMNDETSELASTVMQSQLACVVDNSDIASPVSKQSYGVAGAQYRSFGKQTIEVEMNHESDNSPPRAIFSEQSMSQVTDVLKSPTEQFATQKNTHRVTRASLPQVDFQPLGNRADSIESEINVKNGVFELKGLPNDSLFTPSKPTDVETSVAAADQLINAQRSSLPELNTLMTPGSVDLTSNAAGISLVGKFGLSTTRRERQPSLDLMNAKAKLFQMHRSATTSISQSDSGFVDAGLSEQKAEELMRIVAKRQRKLEAQHFDGFAMQLGTERNHKSKRTSLLLPQLAAQVHSATIEQHTPHARTSRNQFDLGFDAHAGMLVHETNRSFGGVETVDKTRKSCLPVSAISLVKSLGRPPLVNNEMGRQRHLMNQNLRAYHEQLAPEPRLERVKPKPTKKQREHAAMCKRLQKQMRERREVAALMREQGSIDLSPINPANDKSFEFSAQEATPRPANQSIEDSAGRGARRQALQQSGGEMNRMPSWSEPMSSASHQARHNREMESREADYGQQSVDPLEAPSLDENKRLISDRIDAYIGSMRQAMGRTAFIEKVTCQAVQKGRHLDHDEPRRYARIDDIESQDEIAEKRKKALADQRWNITTFGSLRPVEGSPVKQEMDESIESMVRGRQMVIKQVKDDKNGLALRHISTTIDPDHSDLLAGSDESPDKSSASRQNVRRRGTLTLKSRRQSTTRKLFEMHQKQQSNKTLSLVEAMTPKLTDPRDKNRRALQQMRARIREEWMPIDKIIQQQEREEEKKEEKKEDPLPPESDLATSNPRESADEDAKRAAQMRHFERGLKRAFKKAKRPIDTDTYSHRVYTPLQPGEVLLEPEELSTPELNHQVFQPGKRVRIAPQKESDSDYDSESNTVGQSSYSKSPTTVGLETPLDKSRSVDTTDSHVHDDSPEARDPDGYKEQFDRILALKQGILEEDAKDRQAAIARKAREEEQKLMDINLEQIRAQYRPVLDKMKRHMEAAVTTGLKKPSVMTLTSIESTTTMQAGTADVTAHGELKKQLDVVEDFCKNVENRNEFYGMAKRGDQPLFRQQFGESGVVSFIQQCKEENELVTAELMQKLKGRQLVIIGHRISPTVARALNRQFMHGRNIILKMTLDGNQLNDEGFGEILAGIAVNQESLKSLTYKSNEFGPKSMLQLSKILQRRSPANLNELRIIDCKLQSKIIEEMLKTLVAKPTLRRFALVNVKNLGQDLLAEELVKLIQQARRSDLVELDLSWNRLSTKHTSIILQALAENNTLHSLNMGWNNIDDFAVGFLKKFVRRNSSLVLLDLSTTSMTASSQAKLLRCIKKAKSLQVIDLSGNVPLTQAQSEQVAKVLNISDSLSVDVENYCKIESHVRHILKGNSAEQLSPDQDNSFDESLIDLPMVRMMSLTSQAGSISKAPQLAAIPSTTQEDIKDTGKLMNDSLRYKKIKDSLADAKQLDLAQKVRRGDERFILQRMLNTGKEMPELMQWHEISPGTRPLKVNEDWIRGKHIYTAILWSRDFAHTQPKVKALSADQALLARIDELMQQPDVQAVMESALNRKRREPIKPEEGPKRSLKWPKAEDREEAIQADYIEPPFFAGSFNDWRYCPMMKVQDLCFLLDSAYEDPFAYMRENDLVQEHVKQLRDMNQEEMKMYESHRSTTFQGYTRRWFKILMNSCMLYRHPQFINLQEFEKWPPKSLASRVLGRQPSLLTSTETAQDLMRNLRKRLENSPGRNMSIEQHNSMNAPRTPYSNLNVVTNYQQEMRRSSNIAKNTPLHELAEGLKKLKEIDDQLWVGIAIARPGKHQYIVKYKEYMANTTADSKVSQDQDSDSLLQDSAADMRSYQLSTPSGSEDQGPAFQINEHYAYSFHTCLIAPRQEAVPPLLTSEASKTGPREEFYRDETVFGSWRKDTEYALDLCLKNDQNFWKLPEFIQSKKDLEESIVVLRQHFKSIKKIFTIYAARSSEYPCIDWPRYLDLCRDAGLLGESGPYRLSEAQLDKAFIDTNVEIETMPDNPSAALQRFEFLEIIVRIAGMKYVNTHRCKTYAEATKKLIEEHILRLEQVDQWQEFRDHQLWKPDVAKVFEVNSDSLFRIYQSYVDKHPRTASVDESQEASLMELGSTSSAPSVAALTRRNTMTIVDVLDFVVTDSGIDISQQEAIYLYGMSKQTVVKENSNCCQANFAGTYGEGIKKMEFIGSTEYFQMSHSEFYEMLARMACLIHEQRKALHGFIEDERDLGLSEKVDQLLEQLLPNFNAVYKRPGEEDEPEVADSAHSSTSEDGGE